MRTRYISPKGKLIATCFLTSSVSPKLTRYSNECATKHHYKKHRKPLFKPLVVE